MRIPPTALLLLVALSGATHMAAQPPAEGTPSRDVEFELRSAEIRSFDPPIRIGSARRSLTYPEALVFTLEVDRAVYDGLPPSVEPFFYVGSVELRTFEIVREEESQTLLVVFHAPDWSRLREGAAMVLTADHGAPSREPERYSEAPRYSRSMVQDLR